MTRPEIAVRLSREDLELAVQALGVLIAPAAAALQARLRARLNELEMEE